MNDVPHENEKISTDADETEYTPETYETDSGMVADIDDVEVDVVHSGDGVIVSSQADPEAYGIDVTDHVDVPELPDENA